MTPDLTVERLHEPTKEDRSAILALEGESFSNPWTPEAFDTMLASPAAQLFVARLAGNRIVGFSACWVFGDELHINTLAVAADVRRRGIASALLGEVLRSTAARQATLEVRRSNTAALRLYERFGFKVTAVRHRYYQNPEEDGLILWLNP